MNVRAPFAVSLVVLLLAGCATLVPQRVPTPVQFDAWVAAQQYDHALTLLDGLQAHTPGAAPLLARRTEVEQAAVAYEKSVLASARARHGKGELAGAIEELDAGLRNYSRGAGLQQEHAHLVRIRDARQRSLDERMLLARTEWLLKQAPLQQEQVRLKPNDAAAVAADVRIQTELSQCATRLLACALLGLEEDRLSDAEQCLKLAARIQETEVIAQTRDDIAARRKARRTAARKKKEAAAEADRRQEFEALLARARDALALSNLVDARALLEGARTIDARSGELDVLQQTLDQAIVDKTAMFLRKGTELYRNGEIAQAREAWLSGLELTPNDEQLQTNLQRAERVLERLRELQGNGVAEDPAAPRTP